MSDPTPKRLAIVFAAIALVISMTATFEGKRNVAYKDVGNVSTDCYGHTGPDVGPTKTDEECGWQLAADELKHGVEIDQCLPIDTPLKVRAAFIDFAYNVGAPAFCRSTAARRAQHGDFRGACAELSKWVYGGGKVLPGLVKRRAAERALCEAGLDPAGDTTGGYNSVWSDARPPARFQQPSQMVVDTYPTAVLQDKCVAGMQMSHPPAGLTIRACSSGLVVYMPNPCDFAGDAYADLLCHEQGHVNGWSSLHEE